jgi:glycosyltransferase involved in cell wall biosynthesis
MNPAINLAVGRWCGKGYSVAWTYHDLLVPYLFPKAGSRLRNAVTMRPAHVADLTIVTNEADRRELAGTTPHLFRVPIGSNVPTCQVSPAKRAEIRQQLGYKSDSFVIAYFGFLNRSKGGIALIRTLELVRRRLPQVRLLMIGERVGASDPTNYAYLQEVGSLIQELGLQEAVQWTGRLEDVDVSNALAAADVLYMPYEDGASLRRGTLMAGLANGCAVVTTEPRVPIPELADGSDVLFVPRGDVEAATAALLRMASDQRLCAQLQRGALAASRQFTWPEIAKTHAALYASVGH